MAEPAFAPGNPWPACGVHVEWGRVGLDHAVALGDGVVIVDVMSFSTAVAMLTERSAAVRALAPDAIAELGGREEVAKQFGAHVAGTNRADADAPFTLSPSTAVRVATGDRLVLPSLNGGMLAQRAESAPFAIVAGLRNAAAVGHFVAAALRLSLVDRVTIVAAGEQWKADWPGPERTRFAIEDWLGAGAIAAAAIAAGAGPSAEAEVAARTFSATAPDLEPVLFESASGRELVAAGFEADVALAAAVNADTGVAWMRPDAFIERLPFTWRPATDTDRRFLFSLKQATMRDYIVETFGRWDDGDQHANYGPDLARIAVVEVDGRAVAMVEARVEADGLYLANIQVAPEWQRRGLGSGIVEVFAAIAHRRGRALVLRVLKVNRRARAFYERQGLTVTGELAYHWAMALPPPAM